MAELDAHEGVQHRVQAAVEVGQAGGDDDGLVQGRSATAGVFQGAVHVQRVDHQGDIVGRPADKEDHHQCQDDQDGPLLLETVGALSKPQQDAGVGEDQDGGGQDKAHDVVEQARHQAPVDVRLGVERIVMNALYSVPHPLAGHGPQEDPVRDGEEQGEEPHGQAAGLHHPGLPAGVHVCSVDDGEVAVQADAGQQEDPAVEVDLGEPAQRCECI